LILLDFQSQKIQNSINLTWGQVCVCVCIYIDFKFFKFLKFKIFFPQFCNITKLAIILFFFPILLCDKTGDHPQEDLAKFGYRPDMKVEIF